MARYLAIVTVFVLLGCGDNSSNAPSTQVPASQEQFLVENAAREEVTVSESGLQYEVLRAASGPMPSAESMVTVHFTGELFDGTEIANTYSLGEPATFELAGSIDGWIEGVPLMNVGSQFRFVMPANLAHGTDGDGMLIPPDAALVFEIELLEINAN